MKIQYSYIRYNYTLYTCILNFIEYFIFPLCILFFIFQFDIPTYFSLMLEYPVVDVSTLKTILPIKPVPIDKMYYQVYS